MPMMVCPSEQWRELHSGLQRPRRAPWESPPSARSLASPTDFSTSICTTACDRPGPVRGLKLHREPPCPHPHVRSVTGSGQGDMGAVGGTTRGPSQVGAGMGVGRNPVRAEGLQGRQQEPDGGQPSRPRHGSWSERDPEAQSPGTWRGRCSPIGPLPQKPRYHWGCRQHCSILFAFTVPVSLV